MKKVFRLVHVQLWAVLGDMLSLKSVSGKKRWGLYASVLVFLVFMSGLSFFYSLMIGSGLKLYHSIELLPAMMMTVTCLVLFITTTFRIKGTVFGFKDYDMVMSLPVSTTGVIASRLIILYVINAIFVLMLMVPMMIAYGILEKPSALFYIYGVIALFFVPFVPIVLASVVGTVIALVASKFRHSNLLNIILTMGLLVTFIGLSFTIKDNGQEMVDMSRGLTDQVNSLYPLAALYTGAVTKYHITELALFVLVSVLAFLLYIIVVKSIFKKMNTAIMTGSYHRKFKLKGIKTTCPFRALLRKEWKRYFSSSLYVVNTAMGIVMLTAGTVALFFVDLDQFLEGQIPVSAFSLVGPIMISFCVVLSSTTMASISLEGKSLWIVKSLPIEPKKVYLSKIALNLIILSPCLVDALLLGIALKYPWADTLLLILMTAALSAFISCYGLLINLLLPNFNWTNETNVIKQSAATMVTIFSSFVLCAIQFVILSMIPSKSLSYLVFTLLIAAMDVALYLILTGYGKRRYAQL